LYLQDFSVKRSFVLVAQYRETFSTTL
jgi:hypothetical protein